MLQGFKEIDDNIQFLLMEARDNVRFLSSVEHLFEPLYRCRPLIITHHLPKFMNTLRNIFNCSAFFKTNERISSFFSKISNQVIIASKNYLTNNRKIIIWNESMSVLVQKINECLQMQETYRINFDKLFEAMEASNEFKFEYSESFLFNRLNAFNDRLTKICTILETCLRYQVLEQHNIGDMEQFSSSIERAFQRVSSRPYDPLSFRTNEFEKDLCIFQRQLTEVEIGIENFVIDYVKDIPTTLQRILALKRFDRLQLPTVKIIDRYIDLARMLWNEIEDVKDKYNEERASPPIQRGVPPCVGRIMWARSLRKRIQEPLQFLLKYDCVFGHKITQRCIKMYNFLTPIFLEYEATTHKAWYDYVDQVRKKLELPILRKNPETNRYELNLKPYILQAIKESEWMWKAGLQVPKVPGILTVCKDQVLDSYNIIKELLRRNDEVRLSIYPCFLPLMKIHLIKLERIFAPALTQITWLTFNINEYFIEISRVLDPIEEFVKDISDMNDSQIEAVLAQIQEHVLIYLPDEPVTPEVLKELNIEHRKEVEKSIEIKSLAAEKAAVDLINKFVLRADCVPLYDDSGKFQVPLSEITDENRRYEEVKPIDKYDWLSFEKIYKAVGYATPEENKELCFNDYYGLNYNVTLLHIDCVELFAYYNHKIIAALAKCTKRSMELLKERANLMGYVKTFDCSSRAIAPLMKTSIKLKIPYFYLAPNVFDINTIFETVLLNILETHYAVTTWGKQAKTKERKSRRELVPEKRHEKSWFKTIQEHKDVLRYKLSFEDGVLQLHPEIDIILKDLKTEYEFLWASDREEIIEEFVQSNPLTADIRDKLIYYDSITADVYKIHPFICIGLLQIDCNHSINMLVQESKQWKSILGTKLCAYYQIILEKNVIFISAQDKILCRELENLDDCRVAMDCLKVIRDNFIDIDNSLMLMEQTYAVFQEFELNVPSEDLDRVDGLRYQFNRMVEAARIVGEKVAKMQLPLLRELEAGVVKFKNDVQTFDDDFIKKGPMIEGIPAKEASDRVLLFDARLADLQNQEEIFSSGEKLFGLPINEYPILQKRKRDINYLNRLYKLYLDVMYTVDEYFVLPFSEVDMERINGEIQEFVNRCKALPKGMKNWPAFIDLKKKIDDFYECCPLIEYMASNAMKPRHWELLQNLVQYTFDTEDEDFTLGYVMKAPLLENKESIEEICAGAQKEQDIEIKLQTVIREWKDVDMPLALFKNRGELLIKAADIQDIIAKLEDSLMIMSSLLANRFNGPFKKDIKLWLDGLSDTAEILDKWLQVQSLWMYLEAVFVGGDISKQLPQEAKRFGNIDRAWTKIMYKTRNILNIIELCTGDGEIPKTLDFLVEQLEQCQKSLTVYLESKRLIFPRFFFISDPVLLEILGQASDPSSIQPHLLSLFDGVARVEFDHERGDTIISMMSSNGEKIPLTSHVRCIGLVENWIGKLLESVLETMKKILGDLGLQISDAKFDYKAQLSNVCAQAQMICIQLIWTKDVEFALNNCMTNRRIMGIKYSDTQEMLSYLVDQTVKDLTKLERICSETLVTIHVHQRDIFNELMSSKIRSSQDFDWQKQSRFYYDLNLEEILVKITDVDFIYQNEYLGVTERLAITPLTDRCYITLAQAIGMNMGGAPAGPAGTGKTETTKDMGRALGKLVVVFNCSDQMDFRGLGRIFKGLAQSGSWGCFDEFNRIELPVLSVAAQQIYIVLSARKERVKTFIFSDGDTVKLNFEFGIFITVSTSIFGRTFKVLIKCMYSFI